MKFICNDVEVDYVSHGEGKPILLIHGYGVDKRCILNSVEPLSSQLEGFKRYYIDLPHMGQSNWPSSVNSSDDYLKVLEKFIEDIIPDVVAVVGYSYGGYLAMGLQQLKPTLPAFLLCSVTEPIRDKRELPQSRVVYVDDYIKSISELKIGYEHSVIQTKDKYERALLDFEEAPTLANTEKLAEIIKNHYEYSFKLDKTVSGKTLALFGRLDDIVGYKDFDKLEPLYENVDVVVLDHAGHSLPIEQQEKFEKIFISWVREI